MVDDHRGLAAVVVGSVVIAVGSTLAGINAFEGRVWWVLLGFVLFIGGYAVSQFGVHVDGVPASDDLAEDDSWSLVLRCLLLSIGVAGIAVGVTMFAQTILDPSLEKAILSGISSIGGYMVAHVGINQTGLGWSFFREIEAAVVNGRRRS